MGKYDHRAIEKKWQKKWEDEQTFKADIDPSKPKYYILDMFPYPSGAGLHVGHVTGYTATDILARYKRQRGFNVLHPMGWDSFGLAAEQYAVRTGTHPKETTEKNCTTYRKQLKSVGFSYDWSREVMTSDPKYYKWTQWIFTKLFEKGLAYEANVLVNYCPHLRTVLANEEVEEGRSKEGGYPIERRPLRQWVLKITAYADKLLDDLDALDWPDYLKRIQRNWIGRSEGALIDFKTQDQTISVFTTCPHTLFGCSYLVLAPEHPFVDQLTNDAQKENIQAYRKQIASKSDLERTELSKEKTGVFTGAYALNPVNDEQIPIWISDYVLMGYGTGAVMAVPAHDERDFEFASKYDLPIRSVIIPDSKEPVEGCWTGSGELKESGFLNGLTVHEAIESITKWLEKNQKGKQTKNYRLRDWLFSRQRYWGEPIPILHFEDGTMRALELDELPLMPPYIDDYKPAEDGKSPLAKISEWVEVVDPKTGKKALRETNTMPQWAGSCWYYLRFADPHNEEAPWSAEAEKYWLPVDLYVGGVEHAVLHLLYARFWHKVLFDLQLVSTEEPFLSLRNQGLVTAKAYKKRGGGYLPFNDVIEENQKFYSKEDHEPVEEILEKMSKSKFNGVTPDEIIEEFGADALRLYEMFMAPFDKEKLWNTDAVNGSYRFLKRFYDMVFSDKVSSDSSEEAMKLSYRLLKGVTDDIEKMQFNTAVAKMMEFINSFTKLKFYPVEALKIAVQSLYPFAPHLAEECFEHLGGTHLTYAPLPQVIEAYLIDETTTYIFQVNGKVRGRVELPKGKSQEDIFALVEKDEKCARHLEGEIKKIIFIPNKLINIVVQPK
ncbi:MAG: leucine--tRNA ligase [Simkaniaceae bacterium]